MRNLIIILILFGFILPPVVFTPGEVAYGAELNGWYAYIYVGVDEAYKRLTIGQNKQAKEGYDKLWESPVPKTFLSAVWSLTFIIRRGNNIPLFSGAISALWGDFPVIPAI